MADDGMLLNFSIPETGILNKPKFKGGSWKDRLTAKKAAGHWHEKASGRLNGEEPKKRERKERSFPQYQSGEGDGGSVNANRTAIGTRTARPQSPPAAASHDLEVEGFERQAKRARVSGDFRPSSHATANTSTTANDEDFRPSANANLAKRPEGKPKGGKQIISSLFTYNPTSTTKPPSKEDEPETEDAVVPSNAPLTSELDTFTSLGMSETLAAHLLKKMDLKAPTAIQKAALMHLLKDDTDAYIQAETGSGKTLAYLLPIVQRLMEISLNMKKRKSVSSDDKVHRDSGLFAIILAPTRELSKQIALVLEKLLGCAHWLVAGTVIGGEKKKSEKARLRKGLNILVATPGRLADHLEHTEALDVSNVRWLVLDEGDRLMELGFEDEIQKIVGNLNNRMKAAKSTIPGLPEKRTTILCSATMKMDVERLGQISLKDAVHIRGDPSENDGTENEKRDDGTSYAPAQLKQSYAVVAPKLRLVSLISYLKRAFARKGSVMKAVLFISCADSVDFHFDVLTSQLEEPITPKPIENAASGANTEEPATGDASELNEKDRKKPKVTQSDPTKLTVTHAESPLLSPKTHQVTTYRLHGSLPQALRTSTLAHFTKNKEPCLLIATDVASRGLDLPNVDLVIEFDPAFARDDHLHRIGRTARAGRDGRACIFLMPGCEEGYTEILKSDRKNLEGGVSIARQDADEILKKGLVTSGVVGKNEKGAYMDKATDLQLDIERWALASPARLEAARRAYQSHVRAYATHVAAERIYFDIKQLHLGHLAKAFALRERPSGMKVPGLRTGAGREQTRTTIRRRVEKDGEGESKVVEIERVDENEEAGKMRKAVRNRERMFRNAGASEFNVD